MKLKIGDIVQTTASARPPRRVGKVIVVGGDTLPYRVEFLDGHAEWFYESELRPYKKKSMKVKPATRKKKEPSCVHDDWRYLRTENKFKTAGIAEPVEIVGSIDYFYCTKCLEIVSK